MASILEEFGVGQNLQLQLQGLMKLEMKQHITVYFSSKNKAIGEVTRDIRDKAMRNARLISNIFDLPSDIFLTSVLIVDRYLSRVQVKANLINIISLGSLHLACSLAFYKSQESQVKMPTKKDMILFLRKQFKLSDFNQIEEMLFKEFIRGFPIVLTPLTFKRLFDEVMFAVAEKLNLYSTYKNIAESFDNEKAMEIVACDSNSMKYCAREIALSVLFTELNKGLMEIKSVSTPEWYETTKQLRMGIGVLQAMCKITNKRFIYCYSAVYLAFIKYGEPKKYTSLAPRTSVSDKIKIFSWLPTVNELDELSEM